jgi:chromosome segregation ATPase
MTLAEASKRLIDITARYKRQVEQLSREMGRSQNDMHLKLSKFAMMCKDLNDESAKRKEQVDNVKTDLNDVKEERNAISSELEILRARVNLYEKQEAENVEIRRLLRENQDETLAMTDQAISERDGIISDLTAKLEQSMAMK